MVRPTERLDMTIVVDWDVKSNKNKQNSDVLHFADFLFDNQKLIYRNKPMM